MSRSTWKRHVPQAVLDAVVMNARKRCEWCDSKDQCGIDHIYPKGRGGVHKIWNFQYLCNKCGCWKGHDLPRQVVFRINRLKVTSKWSASVKQNGLRIMEEFIRNGNRREGFFVNGEKATGDVSSYSDICQQYGLVDPQDKIDKIKWLIQNERITIGQVRREFGLPPFGDDRDNEQAVSIDSSCNESGGISVFPNPLEVNLGEGRILMSCFTDVSESGVKSHGVILSFNDGSAHDVGEQIETQKSNGPSDGQVYIRCATKQSALVLLGRVQNIVARFEADESAVVPLSEIVPNDDCA